MSEARRKVHTDDAPAAIGPYSQAVVHGGVAYLSGQIALDPATGKVVKGCVATQTKQVLKNLSAVLTAAGSSLDQVLKCTVYLKSMDDFATVNTAYAEFFHGDAPPARAAVEVSRLPKDVSVEIDAIAAVG